MVKRADMYKMKKDDAIYCKDQKISVGDLDEIIDKSINS